MRLRRPGCFGCASGFAATSTSALALPCHAAGFASRSFALLAAHSNLRCPCTLLRLPGSCSGNCLALLPACFSAVRFVGLAARVPGRLWTCPEGKKLPQARAKIYPKTFRPFRISFFSSLGVVLFAPGAFAAFGAKPFKTQAFGFAGDFFSIPCRPCPALVFSCFFRWFLGSGPRRAFRGNPFDLQVFGFAGVFFFAFLCPRRPAPAALFSLVRFAPRAPGQPQ